MAERLSTGPYKHGDDWTGFFIRGDEALGRWAITMRWAADILDGKSPEDPKTTDRLKTALSAELRDFVAQIKRCNENG